MSPDRGSRVVVVAIAVCLAAALSACMQETGADPGAPSASAPSSTPSGAAGAVAPGRAIAAVALSHLRGDQVEATGGFDGASGSTVTIDLSSGPGGKLYVSTVAPEYGTEHGTCAQVRRQLARGERLLSCTRADGAAIDVIAQGPGKDHSVLGSRVSSEGRVNAWVDPATDDAAAQELIEDVLNDPRLGFRMDAATIRLGQDVSEYEDMEVYSELTLE